MKQETTEQEIIKLRETISKAKRRLELSRIWDGKGWHWNAGHPTYIVKAAWEILNNSLEVADEPGNNTREK